MAKDKPLTRVTGYGAVCPVCGYRHEVDSSESAMKLMDKFRDKAREFVSLIRKK